MANRNKRLLYSNNLSGPPILAVAPGAGTEVITEDGQTIITEDSKIIIKETQP